MKKFLLLLAITTSTSLFAQRLNNDSLVIVWNRSENNLDKINSGIEWSKQFYLTADYNLTLQWVDSCSALTERLIIAGKQNHFSKENYTQLKIARGNILNIRGNVAEVKSNFPEALDYFQEALDIFTEAESLSGQAKALGNIAMTKGDMSHPKEALTFYDSSLSIYRQIGDEANQARILGNMGNIHSSLGAYSVALDYHFQAIRLYEKLGREREAAQVKSNVGIVYYYEENYVEALSYFQSALQIARKYDNKENELNILSNMGATYERMEEYSQALPLYNRSLVLSRQAGDVQGMAIFIGNIANIYRDQGDSAVAKGNSEFAFSVKYPMALNYYLRALKLSDSIGQGGQYAKVTNLGALGMLYNLMGKNDLAKENLTKAISLGDSINSLENVKNYSLYLSEIYRSELDCKNALIYYTKYSVAKDSLAEITSPAMQKQIEMEYSFNKERAKDALISDQKEKRLLYLIFLLIFTAAVYFILAYMSREESLQMAALVHEVETNSQKLLEKVSEKEQEFEASKTANLETLKKMHSSMQMLSQYVPGFVEQVILSAQEGNEKKLVNLERRLKRRVLEARKKSGVVLQDIEKIGKKFFLSINELKNNRPKKDHSRRKKAILFGITAGTSILYLIIVRLLLNVSSWDKLQPYFSILDKALLAVSSLVGIYTLYSVREKKA